MNINIDGNEVQLRVRADTVPEDDYFTMAEIQSEIRKVEKIQNEMEGLHCRQ